MTDNDTNTNNIEHVLFLKDEVLRFAAEKRHTHTSNEISGLNLVPTDHSSADPTYGAGTKDKFGHVKVDEGIITDSTNPVQSNTIQEHITKSISTFGTNLKNTYKILDSTFTGIVTSISADSTDKQIPTAKAVWNAITSYKDLLTGVALDKPKNTTLTIDKLTTPGYYKEKKVYHFNYGGEKIYYANGLIKVEQQGNRTIQHVYATTKIKTNDGEYVYKINGAEYTRWGTSSTNWRAWHCAHKPYTRTTRACRLGAGVDDGSVVVYENTAGFIIHWDQRLQEQDRYPITAELYEYAKVCEFEPPLPIKGPYVIGNLIGRCDFKITSNKFEIRSNVPKGGRIIGMHETFFVPRNQ